MTSAFEHLLLRLAAQERIDAQTHELLAGHPNREIRSRWAGRPDVPETIAVRRVLAEREPTVVGHLLRNPALPARAITAACSHPNRGLALLAALDHRSDGAVAARELTTRLRSVLASTRLTNAQLDAAARDTAIASAVAAHIHLDQLAELVRRRGVQAVTDIAQYRLLALNGDGDTFAARRAGLLEALIGAGASPSRAMRRRMRTDADLASWTDPAALDRASEPVVLALARRGGIDHVTWIVTHLLPPGRWSQSSADVLGVSVAVNAATPDTRRAVLINTDPLVGSVLLATADAGLVSLGPQSVRALAHYIASLRQDGTRAISLRQLVEICERGTPAMLGIVAQALFGERDQRWVASSTSCSVELALDLHARAALIHFHDPDALVGMLRHRYADVDFEVLSALSSEFDGTLRELLNVARSVSS